MKKTDLLIPSNLSEPHVRYWSSVLQTQDAKYICESISHDIKKELFNPIFIGSGNESIVFLDNSRVKKFLVSWPKIRAPINITLANLKSVSKRIPIHCNHFYPFEVKKITDHIILLTYEYEESKEVSQIELEKEWHHKWRNNYIDVFEEAEELNISILDPKIKNFRLIKNKLKFIDYGRDILVKEAGWIEINRMFSMYKNGIYNLGPSIHDYKF